MRQQWLDAIGKSSWIPKSSWILCSLHFNKVQFKTLGNKRYLDSDAVPSVNLTPVNIVCLVQKLYNLIYVF